MESTSRQGDKGKQLTKVSASARWKKVVENPPKKRARRKQKMSEVVAAESTSLEPRTEAT
jgi:hypothetical protein